MNPEIHPTRYSILIPAYNEAEGLGDVLRAVLESNPAAEVIVIDDGSTDGTTDVALAAADNGVRVIRHEDNRGYGAALKTGIKAANHDLIAIADADGTYPVDQIPKLVELAAGADMVVGARTTKGAAIPLARRPAKWLFGVLANYMAERKIPDLNSGLRVFRRKTVERYTNLLPDGFSFTTTITLAMHAGNCRVIYQPIEYYPRRGHSKIRPLRDSVNFLQLILRTGLYFAPMRVFGAASAALFAASMLVLLVGWFGFRKIHDVTVVTLFVAAVQMLGIGLVADLINRRLGP